MRPRMLIALVALLGAFVALYLTLYKTGVIGQLACSVGSCETVNLSRWAVFLGLPVAAWGLATYLLLLGIAVAGVQPALEQSRPLSLALLAISGWGFLFSAWLTYLELFVIEAICMWCVISAVLITIIFALAWWDWARGRESAASA